MPIVSRLSQRSGTRVTATARFFVLVLVSLLNAAVATALALNPSTTPAEIIERQLEALKDEDFGTVYEFASPGNRQQTGDVTNFARMVRSGPYRYLVGHSRSIILLESKMVDSRQYLVRVISSSSTSQTTSLNFDEDEEDDLRSLDATREMILEYWWSLSRCKSGEFTGSYMVDAVIPTQM